MRAEQTHTLDETISTLTVYENAVRSELAKQLPPRLLSEYDDQHSGLPSPRCMARFARIAQSRIAMRFIQVYDLTLMAAMQRALRTGQSLSGVLLATTLVILLLQFPSTNSMLGLTLGSAGLVLTALGYSLLSVANNKIRTEIAAKRRKLQSRGIKIPVGL